MAGEIQLNSTTLATESSGTITLSNVDSATNRTNLGLGSIATQAADSVSISGGNITGGTIGSGVVFPAGHILQSKSTTSRYLGIFTSNTPAIVSGFNQQITVASSNSKMLVFIFLAGAGKDGSSSGLMVDITESTTSLNETLSTSIGFSNDTSYMTVDSTLFFEHTHNQTAGTSLTYTPKFSSYNNSGAAFINNYTSEDGDSYSYILVQELMV